MSEERYYLIGYIMDNEGGKKPIMLCDHPTLETALNNFNHMLKGNYLHAPSFGAFPDAYIIKGVKMPIKIQKKGIIE